MTDLAKQIVSLRQRVHESVADVLRDGYLRCGICGGLNFPSAADIEDYLQHGWPRCHAETMTFTPAPKKGGRA